MGQAKARGTFEQRKAEAEARNEAAQREREKEEHAAYLERKARRAQEVAQPERTGLDRTERRRQGRSMLTAAVFGLAASAIHSQAMKRHNTTDEPRPGVGSI